MNKSENYKFQHYDLQYVEMAEQIEVTETLVLSVMGPNLEPAVTIAKRLGYTTKAAVNPILYTLLKDGEIECDKTSNPPLWRKISPNKNITNQILESDNDDERIMIIVDLGNCHDVLKNINNLVDNKTIYAKAYADRAFNGYGIKPVPDNPLIEVYKAMSDHKNAADTRMIWDLAVLFHDSKGINWTVYVCSKDSGFCELKTLFESNGEHTLKFIRGGWEELEVIIL